MAAQADTRPIIVVGSVVMDHKWYAAGQFRGSGGDHPLWRIERRHGGVGRNVAENLARLGFSVVFAGLSGDDEAAAAIERRLRDLGVRLAVMSVPEGVGRFDAHLDAAGQLTQWHIRLPPVDSLTWVALSEAVPDLDEARAVVVETGLAEPMLAQLRDHTRSRRIRLLGMPTRLADLGLRRELINAMDVLVLNESEAAMLTGHPGGDPASAHAQVRRILAAGPTTVVLTCGSRGVVAASADEPEPRHFTVRQVPCVDDTGAGDALTAALLTSLLEDADLPTAVARGLEAARITVGCPHSSCRRVDQLYGSMAFTVSGST